MERRWGRERFVREEKNREKVFRTHEAGVSVLEFSRSEANPLSSVD